LKPQWNQIIKVVFFILLTSSIFFFIAWYLLKRISKNETEILHQKNALILSERRAMAGIFASSVAHDINNILTVIISNLEELSETNNLKPECKELISQLNIGVESLTGLAKRLLNVGKEGIPGDFIYSDLVSVVKETVNFAKNHTKVRHCFIDLISLDSLKITMNPDIIHQMLLNLIINAAEVTKSRGKIEIHIKQDNGQVVIEVHDNGPGIPKEKRAAIFTAFYTTKSNGYGLGLLSVKACAEIHKGTIKVMDSFLGGTCFQISLPILNK
jgi:two-component system sensor histidine kinase HydH